MLIFRLNSMGTIERVIIGLTSCEYISCFKLTSLEQLS